MADNRVVNIRGTGSAGDEVASNVGSLETSVNNPIKPAGAHKGLKIGVLACLSVVFLAALIIGALFPTIVNKQIQNSVINAVVLDPAKMDLDVLAKYYNSSTPVDYYIWTVTNLKNALLNGETLNFKEVGPIYMDKLYLKYNVTWDNANSRVTYKQLVTYAPRPESWPLLSQTVVTVNPFYLGAAASTLQSYIQLMTANPNKTVDFTLTGGYLQDNLLNGLVIGSMITGTTAAPGVLAQFTSANSQLVMKFRALGVAFWISFANNYCQGLAAAGLASCWNSTKLAWSTGGSYLSTLPTVLGAPYNADPNIAAAPLFFTGFELPKTLVSASPSAIATSLFDGTNVNGLVSVTGLSKWLSIASDSTVVPTLMAANGISSINDVYTIGGWLSSTAYADPSGAGAAYQNAVCKTVSGALTKAYNLTGKAGTSSATVYDQQFTPLSSYLPTKWTEIAALQFGSGAVIGIALQSPNLFQYGQGLSASVLNGATITGPGNPFNFDDRATSTFGGAEPMEFQSGAAYAANNVAPTYSPLTALHLSIDPSLLYRDVTSQTIYNLDIADSTALLSTLTSNVANYLQLTSVLVKLVSTYATTFQTVAPVSGVATARATAVGTVQQTIAYLTTLTTCPSEKALGALLTAANVNQNNFYVIFTYLYSYLGNELTGSLANLDADGIAPQNSGLFTKRTVFEVLFGYNARFPNTPIPGVAGTYAYSDTLDNLINADYVTKTGRNTVQDTGNADINRVATYYAYEGTAQYMNQCDLVDPGRQYTCAGPNDGGMNWNDYGEPEVIVGMGDSSQIAPFLEGDKNIQPLMEVYITEAKRSLPLVYTQDVIVNTIDLRRYEVDMSCLVEHLASPNIQKNTPKYKQGNNVTQSPDGFFSVQRVNGGNPILLSKPHWDGSAPDFTGGITCSDSTNTPVSCRTTYNPAVHNTFIDAEPLTGLTMNGAKRLQANFRVSAFEFFSGSAACPTTGTACAPVACTATSPATGSYSPYFGTPLASQSPGGFNFHYNRLFAAAETLFMPWYWADLHDTINQHDTDKFLDSQKKVKDGRKLGHDLQIAGVVIGSVGFVASAASIIYLALM